MAQRMYTEEYIQDIADALRLKTRDPVTKYKVSEMGPAIRGLATGLNATEITVITSTYTTE